MTNSEKQMAKELYQLMGYRQFSDWEVRFIENLYHKPYYDCLTYRQQMYLEKLWQEHIGFPQARPCVFPLERTHFVIHHGVPQITTSEKLKALNLRIRELESAIDRLTNGQSALFRDQENIEHTVADLQERVVELEAFAEEFE